MNTMLYNIEIGYYNVMTIIFKSSIVKTFPYVDIKLGSSYLLAYISFSAFIYYMVPQITQQSEGDASIPF